MVSIACVQQACRLANWSAPAPGAAAAHRAIDLGSSAPYRARTPIGGVGPAAEQGMRRVLNASGLAGLAHHRENTGMSAAIDLVDLIEQNYGGRYERKSRRNGGEYTGPCPFCNGGQDRFQIWPGADFPHYWCRVCGAWGGVAKFLVEKLEMTWEDAKKVEAGMDITQAKKREGGNRADTTPSTLAAAPCLEWQGAALTIARLAEGALWGDNETAEKVRRYLRGPRRGLLDDTIHAAHLGFIPQDIV